MVTPRTGNPRGRPKGAKNIPKTLEAFVAQALANPAIVPPRLVKRKRNVSEAVRKAASERSAHMRSLCIPGTSGPKRGVPYSRTAEQHKAVVSEQSALIDKIMTKMAKDGILPDDPMAVESLKATMVILRSQSDAKTKLAAARLVLDFTKAKPTAKVEHTIRTAEDILDEMAEGE